MYQKVQASSGRKTTNKFIAGIAAFAAAGIITASGLAGATPMPLNNQSGNNDKDAAPMSAQQDQQADLGAEASSGGTSTGGVGYGGSNTSVATNINVNLNNSNNNIIQVFIKIFE